MSIISISLYVKIHKCEFLIDIVPMKGNNNLWLSLLLK